MGVRNVEERGYCFLMEMVEESKSGDEGRLARRACVWSWRKGVVVEPADGDEDDEDENRKKGRRRMAYASI